MRKRVKQPYIHIIDLNAEQKEYVKLCNGKSERFSTYTSWELHIRGLLSKFESPTDLYNFKRYCINHDRVFSYTPSIYTTYVILAITLLMEKVIPILTTFGLLLLIVFALWHGMSQHKSIIKGSCFFKDIIEIIEKIENENGNS